MSLGSIGIIFLTPHLPRLIFPPSVELSVCGKNTSLDTHTYTYSLSVSVSLQQSQPALLEYLRDLELRHSNKQYNIPITK